MAHSIDILPVTFRPRATRDALRGAAAFDRARAAGMKVLDAAQADIETRFGPAYQINRLKGRAERCIKMSYGHPAIRARFFTHSRLIIKDGLTLDQACALVAVCAKGKRALRYGFEAELALILRWLRFKRMHAAFAETVAAARLGARHQNETLVAAE